MLSKLRPLGLVLFGSVAAAAMAGACGDSAQVVVTGTSSGHGGSTASEGGLGGAGAAGTGSTAAFMSGTASGGAGGGATQGFDVQPSAMQTITVTLGTQTPTVAYAATLNGNPVAAGWQVDRGDIGVVPPGPATSVVFTPKGTTGGPVKVTAGLNNQTVSRDVFVKLTGTQNGADPNNPLEATQIATTVASLTAGGGIGGVGGEGLGPAADPALVTALQNPVGDGSAQGLKLVYPYDKTVWPRGLLAPNLMWDWSIGDADAIEIDLATSSGSFTWHGTFGRPTILTQTGKPFIRHPIPQDVWNAATNSAGGADTLTVHLTVAKSGMAYGPISQTYTIAPARLSGIIYYNSYGTQLAQNLGGAVGGNHMFGGAVLSIHGGDTGPKLTAGMSGGAAQCRVCHSVAANGSRLVVQHGDSYPTSSSYDLTPMSSTEHVMTVGAQFPAVFPDGSAALAPNAKVLTLPNAPSAAPTTGLATITTDLGTPSFAPNGTMVAFNPAVGPVANPTQKLYVATFDPTTNAFSAPSLIVDDTGQPAATRPGWPAFTPDEKFVVFHHQTTVGGDGNAGGALWTRKGAKAEIAWAAVGGAVGATRLDQLNGYDAMGAVYLPKLAAPVNLSCTGDGQQVGGINADHGDDVHLNYEPTVNPVASGGYVWVVFTSRRMYGSVATIPPFCSDPRGVDLIQNITPKKLWVAAVDLNAAPGTDASHPAFYLPAQEILAGNSRAFWALDPCKADGNSCNAGDECCNGYCEPDNMGNLVCSNTPPNGMCSQPQEKCTTAGDCCDMTNLCVNGFCTIKGPA